MIDVFRDPTWQFIGVAVAIVLFVIGYFQRKRKVISYQVISNAAVLSVHEELDGKTELLYEGMQVQNVHLIVIKIYNSGNVSVRIDDYEKKQPIKIRLGEESRILSKEVIATIPDGLVVDTEMNANYLAVDPLMLNKKDSFTLKLLVSEFSGKLDIYSRIAGVNQIRHVPVFQYFTFMEKILVVVVFMIFFATAGTYLDAKIGTSIEFATLSAIVGVTVGMRFLYIKESTANKREMKNMNFIPNPEHIDEENPEWSDEMFAQAVPMMEADPELVEMSKQARIKNGKGIVQLETDVVKFFPDADSVNEALRLLIRLITTNRALLAGQS